MVMIACVGVATFDKPGKGATSILQAVIWVSPKRLVMRNATLAPSCSYYASCAAARGAAVGALGSQTLGMTYRIPGIQVALSIEVGKGLSKGPYLWLSGAEGEELTATLALRRGGIDLMQPPTPPIRSLYTRSLRKKRKKRSK
jgi:hypothetical protein